MFEWLDRFRARKFFNNNNRKYEIIGRLNEVYSDFKEEIVEPRKVNIRLGGKELYFSKLLSKVIKDSSGKMEKKSVLNYQRDCNELYELYEKLDSEAKGRYKDAATCVHVSSIVRIFDLIKKEGKEIDESEIKELIKADMSEVEDKKAKEFLKSNLEFVSGKRNSLPRLNL